MKSAEGRDPRPGSCGAAAGFTAGVQACPLPPAGGTAVRRQGPAAGAAVAPGQWPWLVCRSWVQPVQVMRLGTSRGRAEHGNGSVTKLISWQQSADTCRMLRS